MATKKVSIIGMEFKKFSGLNGDLYHATEARLIPTYKFGDEMALASIFLSSLKLIKEFRTSIFGNVEMTNSPNIYYYTEMSFPEFENKRVDGFIAIVRAGKIVDAAFLEMKKGSDILEERQLMDYSEIAEAVSIPKLITISNQFVSTPTQSPIQINGNKKKKVKMYHLSWSFILTVAKLLLADNETNISDPDQVSIMEEVVDYLERDKSGVSDFSKMKPGWKTVSERINKGQKLKPIDGDVIEAVESWLQEEKNMALKLSTELKVLVGSGIRKYREDFTGRLTQETASLVKSNTLSSVLKIENAASNITVKADFGKRTVEFLTSLDAPWEPDAKALKGQIGWIRRRQLKPMETKNPNLYKQLSKDLMVSLRLLGSRAENRKMIDDLDKFAEDNTDKRLKEYGLILRCDMGQDFGNSKIVKKLEKLLLQYYEGIVQHLSAWIPPAPEVKQEG